ncbi:MAG TPA: uroporphyrinogen-III synthase [Bacteroidota bacterium]|nr:uroporphyrinogen-III synthase [Bacteroidota bacterium]
MAEDLCQKLSYDSRSIAVADAEGSSAIGSCRELISMLRSDQFINQPPGTDEKRDVPLLGKVVLVTRPESLSRTIAERIHDLGGLAVVVPMIEISDPDDWYPVDHAIVNLKGYDGIIFTSQNSVERFLARLSVVAPSARTVLASRRVFAVGSKTRMSLENGQIPVTLIPEDFSAAGLVNLIQSEPTEGRQFLFPKGNLTNDEIPSALRLHNAVVDEIEVYRTAGSEGVPFPLLQQMFDDGEIDALTFFSPSAVMSFSEGITPSHVKCLVVCIGPTTRRAAEEGGFSRIVQSVQATAESLVEALADHFIHS